MSWMEFVDTIVKEEEEEEEEEDADDDNDDEMDVAGGNVVEV
jgi:hypothetical protein